MDLKPGEEDPAQSHPFSIPHIHLETLKKEMSRLVKIGALEECLGSSWSSPTTFMVPKKSSPGETVPRVRAVSDFWKSNKKVQREPHPISKVSDASLELGGFQHCAALDSSMGHWHMRLDPKAQEMCTIAFPFGTCGHERLPMGIVSTLDFFKRK